MKKSVKLSTEPVSPFPILALDIGEKRVGIALIKDRGGSADYKQIYPRAANAALQNILDLIQKYSVKNIVAGLPLSSDSRKTRQCVDIEKFCRRIERRTELKVSYVDEYLSSEEAAQGRDNKSHIDDRAAEIILQRYLKEAGILL